MIDVFVVVIRGMPAATILVESIAAVIATIGGGRVHLGYLLPGQQADAQILLKIGMGVCRAN